MDLKDKCLELRHAVLDMCAGVGAGHVASSFSCVEILAVLHYVILRPEDTFILSKGHAAPILYRILADTGRFDKTEFDKFCKTDGSVCIHVQKSVPGAVISGGSLGHGFGIAAGMALANKKNMENGIVFALLGDGELYEGSVWETALFAGHNRLNNLVAVIDRNCISATNFTEDALSLEPLTDKWTAFGWDAVTIDGHSIGELIHVLDRTRTHRLSKPLVVIAETVKGRGINFIENDPVWHPKAVTGGDYERAKKVLA